MESCPKCGMTKGKAGPGSITQWIAMCRCDQLQAKTVDEDVRDAIALCSVCNKRISAGRKGSLTQWVFRSDLCSCTIPHPIDMDGALVQKSIAETADGSSASGIAYGATYEPIDLQKDLPEGLAIDPDNFPLDRYKPLTEIGRGASGILYLATDRMLNKRVAIKCLKTLTPSQLISFQKEAQATSRLNHPNIVKIFDFGASVNGAPYMVMEYVDGINLQQYIRDQGPFSETDAIPVFLALIDALKHAHSRGVFHRDVKSNNVLVLTRNDSSDVGALQVRLIDFGVARAKEALCDTKTPGGTVLVGTPAYMAPEQLAGTTFDAGSEIYSLGCLFYEMLTGQTPFSGETALDLLKKHSHSRVPPPSEVRPEANFSMPLEGIILRCLAKKPEDRYADMTELAKAIETDLLDEVGTSSTIIDALRETHVIEPPAKAQFGKPAISEFTAILVGMTVLSFGFIILLMRLQSVPYDTKSSAPISKTTLDSLAQTRSDSAAPTSWMGNDRREYRVESTLPGRLVIHNGKNNSISTLSGYGQMKEVGLIDCTVSESGLRKILALKPETLIINNSTIDARAFSAISEMNSLRHYSVLHCKQFAGASLMFVSTLPLKSVTVRDANLQDQFLVYLRNLREMETLSIARCPQFTGVGLAELSRVPIKDLSLKYVSISSDGLKAIGKITTLNKLTLANASLTDTKSDDDDEEKNQPLKGLPPYDVGALTSLAALPNLETLEIDSDRLSGEHYKILSSVPRMSSLHLAGSQLIKPADISNLGAAKRLRSLRIVGPCLEREGLAEIARLKNLNRLELCDSELTDPVLKMLEKSKVNNLTIVGSSSISDTGLDSIIKMPNLKTLRLPSVSFITEIGLARLKKQKPDCRIVTK